MWKRTEAPEQRVQRFIQEHHLIPKGSHLLVAVSGGPDSVCLLHLLTRLQAELGINLTVAHLNHGLRDIDAEADAEYVSALTQGLGIPVTIEKRQVKSYQAQHRTSLEEAAREVRYTFLAEVAKSIGADQVAVGHTTDDHIETILLHLIRGSGTRGLVGLQPRSQWQLGGNSIAVVRPLLTLSREETASYCQEHRLAPRLDASNLSLSPLRNRVRHQLLPLLESYNPRITEALLRTAMIAADDLAFIDKAVATLGDEVVQESESAIILKKKKLLELPLSLRRYLLRLAFEKLLGNLRDIEMRHIDGLLAALTKPAGRRINLPGDLVFSIEYDRFLLGRDPAAVSPFPVLDAESTLEIPGESQLPGWQVIAAIIKREQMGESGDFTAYFDLAKTGNKLTVRTRRAGDRFQPLGMSQLKKVSEFMIDAKVPHAWRERIPVVCSPTQVIWLVGWRIDEGMKVSAETEQILRLEFKRR